MNKILLDTENICIKENSVYELNDMIENHILDFDICDNVELKLIEKSECIKNIKINVKQHNNSTFIYKSRIRCKDNYKLCIDVKLMGNNSKNIIDIHGLSDNGNIEIILNGSVTNNTKDNYLDELVKVLTINDGVTNIKPNMFVSSKEVIANHGVSIRKLNEEELFYLNSKGIDYNNSKELLINGFLNND